MDERINLHVSMIGPIPDLLYRIDSNLDALQREGNSEFCVLPVGLFLVIDAAHGGDTIAQELVKRSALLDKESRTVIDFYYLGWTQYRDGAQFDLEQFTAWRNALREVGVTRFDGNADLILVDAESSTEGPLLRFDRSIRINLSDGVRRGDIQSLGKFLADLVTATEEVRASSRPLTEDGVVFHISDKLGLAYAKESILDYLLDKWGTVIGARRLASLAVRSIGPPVKLRDLRRIQSPFGRGRISGGI